MYHDRKYCNRRWGFRMQSGKRRLLKDTAKRRKIREKSALGQNVHCPNVHCRLALQLHQIAMTGSDKNCYDLACAGHYGLSNPLILESSQVPSWVLEFTPLRKGKNRIMLTCRPVSVALMWSEAHPVGIPTMISTLISQIVSDTKKLFSNIANRQWVLQILRGFFSFSQILVCGSTFKFSMAATNRLASKIRGVCLTAPCRYANWKAQQDNRARCYEVWELEISSHW